MKVGKISSKLLGYNHRDVKRSVTLHKNWCKVLRNGVKDIPLIEMKSWIIENLRALFLSRA